MKKQNTYSFKMLAKDVLEKTMTPLTVEEIWDQAKAYGFDNRIETSGKTPWKTLGAQLYVDIRDNPNSDFIQASKRPVKFSLKQQGSQSVEPKEVSVVVEQNEKFLERDLHPLLTSFVYSDSHFKCYTKTIYHEKSSKDKKGKNKWLHPDIVGVYFPFDDYSESTLNIIKSFNENSIRLFSFEMKISIDMTHLREYFFQAVSNSSWANEGYLVALKYSEDSVFIDEMRRLNNAFGIGFIKLNAEDVAQSEILLPARENKSNDWEMINRLVEENPDFKSFIDWITEDYQLKKVKSKYDDILSPERMQEYIIAHGIE